MQRRQFIKFCAASAAVSSQAFAGDATPRFYARAALVGVIDAAFEASRGWLEGK